MRSILEAQNAPRPYVCSDFGDFRDLQHAQTLYIIVIFEILLSRDYLTAYLNYGKNCYAEQAGRRIEDYFGVTEI